MSILLNMTVNNYLKYTNKTNGLVSMQIRNMYVFDHLLNEFHLQFKDFKTCFIFLINILKVSKFLLFLKVVLE